MGPWLAERWWTFVLRGAVAIAFGIITFINPGMSLMALILLWGIYACVDGLTNFSLAFRRAQLGERWGVLVAEGIVSIAAGVAALVWPGITSLILLVVIGFWAIITGLLEVAAAFRLRNLVRHEWLLGLAGILSIAFGVMLFLFPGSGALAMILWIGAYAVVFGGLEVGLGFRLLALRHSFERRIPTGGVPGPA